MCKNKTQTPKEYVKGEYQGRCNRSACLVNHEQTSIEYFNKSTRAYYCATCAFMINEANNQYLCVPVRTEDEKIAIENGRDTVYFNLSGGSFMSEFKKFGGF